jgi:hypothetical protein
MISWDTYTRINLENFSVNGGKNYVHLKGDITS